MFRVSRKMPDANSHVWQGRMVLHQCHEGPKRTGAVNPFRRNIAWKILAVDCICTSCVKILPGAMTRRFVLWQL